MEDKEISKAATTQIKDVITFTSMDQIRAWGEEVAKSKFTPLKTGADVVAAYLTGQELGFKPMFSANNIYPINGKATLGIHAMAKLLLEAGVIVEILRDYEPCVNFVMRGEDISGNIVPVCLDKDNKEVPYDIISKRIPEGCKPIIIREGFINEVAGDFEIKGKRVTNYKTVIKFTRLLKQPDGKWLPMVVISSYSLAEASSVIIGDKPLMEKDNWKNWTKIMVYTRTYTTGAKRIGDDLFGGLPETSEYADFKGIEYTMEEGKVNIITKNTDKSVNTDNLSEATTVLEEEVGASDDVNKEKDPTNNINN